MTKLKHIVTKRYNRYYRLALISKYYTYAIHVNHSMICVHAAKCVYALGRWLHRNAAYNWRCAARLTRPRSCPCLPSSLMRLARDLESTGSLYQQTHTGLAMRLVTAHCTV